MCWRTTCRIWKTPWSASAPPPTSNAPRASSCCRTSSTGRGPKTPLRCMGTPGHKTWGEQPFATAIVYERHVTSSADSKGILIVGGGLAATRTAEQLRRAEYSGSITIVSDEAHLPYDRPPLSKEVLRKEVDDVALKPREFYDEKDIILRLGSAASSLDTAAQTVTLADGTVLGYDELVIATGLVPRRIPAFPDLEGIRVLRSFGERMAIRQHASEAQHAVVIGAGFIGCEVAASLRSLGVAVVLVEPQPTPLALVLGEQIGGLVARLHRDEGVDVLTGVSVAEVRGQGHVEPVVPRGGTELTADLVVVGIGSRPATEWLEG